MLPRSMLLIRLRSDIDYYFQELGSYHGLIYFLSLLLEKLKYILETLQLLFIYKFLNFLGYKV